MGNFRLPSKKEVFGRNRSDVFKKIGRVCDVTDFAYKVCSDDYSRWWLSTTSIHVGGVLYVSAFDYVDGDGNLDYVESIDLDPGFKIRPIMDYSDIQEFKKNMWTNESGVIEVEYGEYPQEIVSTDLNNKLEEGYRKKKLKETGKKYTIALGYIDDNREPVPPVQLTEYEYDGKKYVRYSNFRLIYWIEVSPLVWYVDERRKILISKKLLIGRIGRKNIPKFLRTYFANEVLPIKSKKEEEKKTDTKAKKEDSVSSNEEVSSIEKLINEIHKYIEGNPNKETIIEKLVEMTTEYNKKLDEIGVIAEKNMPSLDTYGSVTAAFELKLKMLLIDVKKHHEVFKDYFHMLAVLDKYIALVNGNKDKEYTDGLVEDLDVIDTVCLPFLKEEDANAIRKQLIDVFNGERREIIDFIDNDKKLSYKTMDEMIINLREKIHPVLGKLSTSVNKRDVEVEIKTTIEKIINGLFEVPRNEVLSFFLVEINNVYTNINVLINKLPSDMKGEYKKEILDIMDMEIDYNREFSDVANDLKTMWLSLNKVYYRIDAYLRKIEQIRSGHIDVNKVKR